MVDTLSFAEDTGDRDKRFVAPYLVRLASADRPLEPSVRMSIAEVRRVTIGRGDAASHRRFSDEGTATLAITVADGWMSTRHAALERDGADWVLRDAGSKNGTFIAGGRVTEQPLRDGDIVEAGNSFFLFRSRVERSFREAADVDASTLPSSDPARVTLSLPVARTMADLARVATSMVPVLLLGETGTGKEVAARMVHAASRRAGELVAVNCGALPANLVESELFGHRKGAFSGATSDRVGFVQASDGGTLFLDEIAELPLEAQVKLLRVLQEREVTPVGGTRPVKVDLRVVAATLGDLPGRVADGRFRADLYGRLAGLEAELLPLRERREDLGVLIATFLRRLGAVDATFERDALRALLHYSWPRNVRELEQGLAAAWALAGGGRIQREHLPPAILGVGDAAGTQDGDAALRHQLLTLMERHQGNVSAVAREMGKARVQIRRWCKRFGVDPTSFR